eukprot:295475-Hanusia_phi.AAC.2
MVGSGNRGVEVLAEESSRSDTHGRQENMASRDDLQWNLANSLPSNANMNLSALERLQTFTSCPDSWFPPVPPPLRKPIENF